MARLIIWKLETSSFVRSPRPGMIMLHLVPIVCTMKRRNAAVFAFDVSFRRQLSLQFSRMPLSEAHSFFVEVQHVGQHIELPV